MKLTVSERLSLLGLLPDESNYAGVREIFRTRTVLGLTGDEAQLIEVEPMNDGTGRIQWNHEKALGVIADIPLGEWMTEVIRGVLRDMDREQKITPEIMSLYEKFIFDYE
jgi:hypothetical protein